MLNFVQPHTPDAPKISLAREKRKKTAARMWMFGITCSLPFVGGANAESVPEGSRQSAYISPPIRPVSD